MIGYNPVTYSGPGFCDRICFCRSCWWIVFIVDHQCHPSMTSGVTTVNALIMTILGGMGTLVGQF